MSDDLHHSPVAFTPKVEVRADDEAETIQGLNEQLRIIQETTAKDYGTAVRGVHAKGHAIVKGTLEVLSGVAPALAQGLFSTPCSYDALLRFSTLPGDILDDSVSVPRGIAVKLFGVAGDRLAGSEDDTTQDFILVNGPAFAAPTPKAFLANLKMLAKTTDSGEGLKKGLSAVLQTVDAALETVGIQSATIQTLGGAPNTHPLGETYYTQVPLRHGDYIAKLSVAPVSPNLTELAGSKVNTSGRPDALREALGEVLIEQDSVWEMRVQLCTDLDKMPVEDSSIVWDENESPYVAVACLTVPAQIGWQHGLSDQQEQAVSFSPWHGLAAHQPLGGVNRARKPTYEMSTQFRSQHNGCPVHELRSLAELPTQGMTID
ncbi:catalase family protein [Sphingomonas sp. Mn802worker]|uniref:catalase family protein n=1 Tax=Sphingomonas sp. Mn802worker TaxID=629773 RepID=UPI0003713CDC|nr:catalase family protein [Sphingomonas sp. Mn802worker]